jgi:hypothetical protein
MDGQQQICSLFAAFDAVIANAVTTDQPDQDAGKLRARLARDVAKVLVAGASAGQASLFSAETERCEPQIADLSCQCCHSVFFKPTALIDGRSVCLPCAAKLRVKPKCASKDLDFGKNVNPVFNSQC